MDSCVFCKIAAGEIPADIIYRDGGVVAFLSIEPIQPGHTVVIPRRHSGTLDEAEPGDVALLFQATQKLGGKIRDFVQADGYNVGLNCGAAAGQAVWHTHVHIIPRRKDDGLIEWPHCQSNPPDREDLATRLRAAIG